MFFLLKHTLIIYHTTCMNAIVEKKAFKKNSLTQTLFRTMTFKIEKHIVKCV
jgi:hypothetical protein